MDKITVKVFFKDLEYTAEGNAAEVIRSVIKWLEEVIPQFDLAQRLTVDIDYVKLGDILSKYVLVSKEGAFIFRKDSPRKLSLSNKILLFLGLAKLMYVLGKRDYDGIFLQDLSRNVGSSSKTVSSRLSELYSSLYVEKEKLDEGILYKITLKGLLKILSLE